MSLHAVHDRSEHPGMCERDDLLQAKGAGTESSAAKLVALANNTSTSYDSRSRLYLAHGLDFYVKTYER